MSHLVLLAAAVIAQTQAAPSTGSALTRSLNAAPPAGAVAAPPREPATVAPTRTMPPGFIAPSPARTAPIPSAPVATPPRTAPITPPAVANPPRTQPLATPPPVNSAPVTAAPRPATPAPTTVAPRTTIPAPTVAAPATTPTRASPTPAPRPTTPAPVAAAPAPVIAEPPVAAMTVLDAPAIRALPFTVDLPAGLTVTTGRPGPNFNIWTIRRGQQPLVMVYAGPASQFPIYSGQMVETTGRASVVATEDGRRVALEHLFTRTTAPAEIHVWITSVEGADRALAEQIGQSIDPR